MPQYLYKARDKDGSIIRGRIDRESTEVLEQQLREMGYEPLEVEEYQYKPLFFRLLRKIGL
jgi:type II secretory pathway component PulF